MSILIIIRMLNLGRNVKGGGGGGVHVPVQNAFLINLRER